MQAEAKRKADDKRAADRAARQSSAAVMGGRSAAAEMMGMYADTGAAIGGLKALSAA